MGGMPQVQLNSKDEKDRSGSILKVDHLGIQFSGRRGFFRRINTSVQAVDDLSFEIFDSEILSIVGESGSGKSSTALCIMRLVEPSFGSIVFEGSDVTKLKGKALLEYRQNVQMIFQDPYESLNPRQDVFTIVSAPIRHLLGERDRSRLFDKTTRTLAEVGLNPAEVIRKLPHQLSGGERQRVNIARALSPAPRLLIADEPVTMLDASQRLSILSLLMDLKLKRRLSVLLITHDLASAKIMSDRTAVMYLGKIVEVGPTKDILSRPHHPYTELILSATPRISKKIRRIDSQVLSTEENISLIRGCRFRRRCTYATDVCKEIDPHLEEKSTSHYASCHNPLNTKN